MAASSLVALAVTTRANAGDPKDAASCKEAYETSQETRRTGALLNARSKLRQCASEACSEVVRTDCITWLSEVERAVPSVVLEAKVEGQIAFDATVTMDGKPFAAKLDGRPIDVDPGVHVFVFAKEGRASIEQRVIVREAQKSLLVAASWQTPGATITPPPLDEPQQSDGGALRTAGFVVGGVGIAGLVVGSIFGLNALSADKRASRECPSSTVCTPTGADDARSAHSAATISTIAFVAGGAFVVGGSLLVLLAPRAKSTRGITVAPSFNASSQMVFLSGAF